MAVGGSKLTNSERACSYKARLIQIHTPMQDHNLINRGLISILRWVKVDLLSSRLLRLHTVSINKKFLKLPP